MRTILTALLVLGLLPGAATAETLATVGKKTITRADVEKEAKSELAEIETARYKAMRQSLDGLVAEALVEQEATARGVTVEELTKIEIFDKAPKPSDAEIQKVYDENKEQLQGQTLDQVKEQIVEFLTRRGASERSQVFIADLKKRYPTKIDLRPPTVDVAIGNAPVEGKADAPITIIVFSDYECPFCKKAEPTIAEVRKIYGDKIRYAFRNYPLPFHANATPAAEAALCANAQGKFWPYHDKVMAAADLTEANLQQIATSVGLDRKKFDECVKAGTFKEQVAKDMADGQAAGVSGTPAFFINGQMLDGAQPVERFKEIIDEELANLGKS